MTETLINGHPLTDLELIGDSYYLFETGEFIGEKLPDAFTVKDDDSLNLVLEKLFNAESDLVNEEGKIKAILEGYERRKKRMQSRRDWLMARFYPEVEAYTRPQITDKKRTVNTPFADCSFRVKKGGLRVADKSLALALAKQEGWINSIKTTEEFQISLLTEDQKESLFGGMTDNSGFTIEPDSETFTIKTLTPKN